MIPNRPIYLDNQATTPCDPDVVQAMLPFFGAQFANPHSVEHVMGQAAEAAVEAARAEVAALLGADPREIVFTSGATEANNLAIKGAARFARDAGDPRRRILTFVTEHPCVLASVRDLEGEGFEPVVLPVLADGRPDLDKLAAALAEPVLLVSVMAANNETGVLADLPAIAGLVKAAGALLHTDAAQAAGKVPLDVGSVPFDLVSLSAHKLYGPKGVGALYVRRRPRVRLAPLFSGGGQERGFRSGTLPVPLLVGFGRAARLAAASLAEEPPSIAALRDRMLARLRQAIPGLVVNGSLSARLAGNLNLTFPAASAAALMRACPDLCLSTGSACSSAEIAPSHVLTAMGLDAQAAGRSLRVGIGRFTSAADIDTAADLLIAAHAALSHQRTESSCPA
ncbi:MAG: aminotransferase class V-fold PLP-dependent enzyme [Rhodospirillales bacterium]|nr:aminotransferase class V-fold PLP-dependent enzyme [Rhodospirillales bacterium]